MADLEKIIRPFETRTNVPINLPPSGTPPDNVVLTYGQNSASGGGGSGSHTPADLSGSGTGTSNTAAAANETVIGHYSNSATFYMTKQEREQSAADPLGLKGFIP